MTDLELAANEEARHGNRDALEAMTEELELLRYKLSIVAVDLRLLKKNVDLPPLANSDIDTILRYIRGID